MVKYPSRDAWQEDAGPQYGPGQYVVLVELIDHDDKEANQYLFTDRNKARDFIFAHVRDIFSEDDNYRDALKSMYDLDAADELLGEANKGFAVKDWVMR